MKGLTHLLDTSVYSQRLRPQPHSGVVSRWNQLGDQALAISSICEAELLYGLEKRNSERLWQEYRASLKNSLVQLPVDSAVARRFARMKAYQERKGKSRADFDLLIAATAVTHGLILATGNIRHFHGIPELDVEDWFR
jgi:tRNA(fMet)-specific endonuclease VapC